MTSSLVCHICGTTLAALDGSCSVCMLRSALEGPAEAPAAASHHLPLPRRFGAYELIEEIARGGMGIVYRARQVGLNRIVALKVLIGGAYSSEVLLSRFKIEAESAAGLQHANIVRIHEFGEHDQQPYYTMDYVQGRNLSEITGGQPLPPAHAVQYMRAIAEVVHFAHERGILHRDLKPSNILIDRDDCPRITDFGLAKRLEHSTDLTFGGLILGSPNYAPPEQAFGYEAQVGVTCDVYSLGALLYSLLIGRPPFLTGTVEETLRLVATQEPVPPCLINPNLPRDLETICLKCLEKDPAQRYASARALGDELGRYHEGKPILARPISPVEHLWRWGRRHPALAALAATAVIALTATTLIFHEAAQRVERARTLEHAARVKAEHHLHAASMESVATGLYAAGGYDPEAHRHLLESTRPQPGSPDLRGFEWRYFWRVGLSEAIATLPGHAHVVDTTRYSPDGTRIVTRSFDGIMKVWDAVSHREILAEEGVNRVGGFTPDGGQLIFSRADQSIWRLDLSRRAAVQLFAKAGALLALRPDGQAVVFGSEQKPILQSLAPGANVQAGSSMPPRTIITVSADGQRTALSGPENPAIEVIDLSARRTLAAFVDPRPVIALALSPDGSRLASAGFDGVIKIWNVAHGTLETSFRGFLDPVWGVTFSADGQFLAAGGNNRRLKIWRTVDWSVAETRDGHTSTIQSVAFSPDGTRLISGGADELVLVWATQNSRTPDEAPQLLRGPGWGDPTPSLAFSPDSRHFVGTAADGTVKIWRADNFALERSFPGNVRTVAFSSDGKAVLGEGDDGRIQRWSLEGSSMVADLLSLAQFSDWQTDLMTAAERVAVVAPQADLRARAGLSAIPSTRDAINAGAMQAATAIAFSQDGKIMVLGSVRGEVEVWDVTSGQRRLAFAAHKMGVTSLAVSKDGRHIATGSLDNSTRLWLTATGKSLATFRAHNRPVWALAFTPDGQTLAAGSCDKSIILYSLPLLQKTASLPMYIGTPRGYEQEVRLLQFSPDSNILAAGLGDGTVRFFRAASFRETDAPVARSGSQRSF